MNTYDVGYFISGNKPFLCFWCFMATGDRQTMSRSKSQMSNASISRSAIDNKAELWKKITMPGDATNNLNRIVCFSRSGSLYGVRRVRCTHQQYPSQVYLQGWHLNKQSS